MGFSFLSLNLQDITVDGNRAFFNGATGLWVTDGTTAGTQELAVSGTTSTQGIASPYNLAAFGNKVLFLGYGQTTTLFVSDGTSAGSFGLSWTGRQPTGLTALGDKVLFKAINSAGKQGLWVTDGTSAGTTEISVPNASIGGVFSGTSFSIRAVIGNQVVFSGIER